MGPFQDQIEEPGTNLLQYCYYLCVCVEVCDVIRACLAFTPDDRPTSFAELLSFDWFQEDCTDDSENDVVIGAWPTWRLDNFTIFHFSSHSTPIRTQTSTPCSSHIFLWTTLVSSPSQPLIKSHLYDHIVIVNSKIVIIKQGCQQTGLLQTCNSIQHDYFKYIFSCFFFWSFCDAFLFSF